MAKSKFYELIKNARIEKDVENVYTQGINLYFPGVVCRGLDTIPVEFDEKFVGKKCSI